MSGDDKAMAIFVTVVFIGFFGGLATPWAFAAAAVAVVAIAFAPSEKK